MAPWFASERERCFESRSRSAWLAFLQHAARLGSLAALLAAPVLGACTPKLNAGAWECPAQRDADGGVAGARGKGDPVTVPWSTGFEDGFCDFPSSEGAGFCYGDDPYLLVSEPHHSGHLAAEFKVVGDANAYKQTRCVRHGALPVSAYYGAYYFIPEALEKAPNWNLFHFQGGQVDDRTLSGSWDVTLSKIADSNEWELLVKDAAASPPPADPAIYKADKPKAVPFGKWFHIELFVKRAADATGKIALYQDGETLFELSNLKSDASPFTQWYVGDWADGATPANSSLYVDDMSISASRTSATP